MFPHGLPRHVVQFGVAMGVQMRQHGSSARAILDLLLADPRFLPLKELMQSSEFRMEINRLPGYDAVDTGMVSTMREAFPRFFRPGGRKGSEG
ncbi:hypothetical protein EGT29_06590 [Pigmentiphaga sp. H8]|uniref:hypothetical protein n=1 Tax=Pigmentiphaga sp. H8 TaxID=2488560 RepID=UPI000F5A6247|nr:hypothetical protein [Pigmentiphaga sp. H8]AZG07568.1 hypothetical protein EGT29_06590 [Pigmentiphaga sp. H8]